MPPESDPPHRLSYPRPVARKRSRLTLYLWLCTAVAYALAMLLPFLIIGETWRMLWFPLSLPLSAWAEDKWGIGRDGHLLIFWITLANGAMVGAILTGLAVVVRDSFARRSRQAQ